MKNSKHGPVMCGASFGYHNEHTCIITIGEHVGFHECSCGAEEDRAA